MNLLVAYIKVTMKGNRKGQLGLSIRIIKNLKKGGDIKWQK